ncbi:methionine ABC transporter ATP-binding protein [Treponema parvum]|uniref:Methionine ABC transporter ATP-binding protein n=1 Tax=Treponema parvum TaxID=138851 RepID=A0A975F2K7_9SPIR|nr:methionine ABC transporter ATP-binding protein [Treponema parvum]QTQ13475.1 methionine ABC transporter ATP-binding protein [Treponema parvum]
MEIILKDLVKTYGGKTSMQVHAVRGVSLIIPSNKIFGIIGKSGAGKSTLVRLISLLESPDSGEVFYNGKRVDDLSPSALIVRRRRIGMIFQNFNLFSSRTAGQNIAYPLEICGVKKEKIKSRVKEMLELVGLADRADAPISTLSGGQKQRIAIARALANDPDILFCDEATSALDPQTTHSILDLIRQIQQKMNLTVVMITHQMEVVRDACSYVAVLNDGAVVEQGSVEDIFMHPKTEATKEFLSHLQPPACTDDGNMIRWSSGGGAYLLRFSGNLTDEPVLSRLSKKFNVEFNIRAGGIQKLQNGKVGTLLTDITGEKAELEKAFAYLKSEGIFVEKTDAGK